MATGAAPPKPLDVAAKRPTIDALTGVRGWAAMWIVAYHYLNEWQVLVPPLARLGSLVRLGPYAVDLFFILSGFVLSYNYLDRFASLNRREYGRFLFMRLARIYPVHLVTLLMVLAIVSVAWRLHRPVTDYGYTWMAFVQNLLLVQAWVPHMKLTWNYPAWSISAEWIAYLLFPFVGLLLHRLGRTIGAHVIVVLVCFALMQAAHAVWGWLAFAELFRVTGTFLTGCALYLLSSHRLTWRLEWLAPVAIAGIVIGPFLGMAWGWLILAWFTLLLFSLAAIDSARIAPGVRALLTSRSFIYLGQISYSLYMTHAVTQKALYGALPVSRFAGASAVLRAAILALYLGAIAGHAMVMYHVVERPTRERLRAYLARPTNELGTTAP